MTGLPYGVTARLMRRFAVVAVLLLVAMLAPAGVAAAASCGNPVDPNISVSPSQGPPGTRVTVSGRTTAGNRVLVDGLGPQAQQAVVPASGVYSVELTVPVQAPSDCYQLQVTAAPPSGGLGSFSFAKFTVTSGTPPSGGSGPSVADLVPTDITFDATTVAIGRAVRFDSGIANRGNSATGVFNVKWFVDGREVGAHGSHSGIPANTEVLDGNSQFEWTFDSGGPHTVTFTVDADSFIPESDEGNNSRAVTVTVPVASCPSGSLRISANSGPAGTKFTISGSGWSSPGTVAVRLPHGSPGIFYVSVPEANVPVAADGSWSLAETVGEPTPSGTYVFTAVQDAPQCVGGRLQRDVSFEVTNPKPAALNYYALGDSYSSGEGVPKFDGLTNTPILDGVGNTCHRSTDGAYPVLFAKDTGADLGSPSIPGIDSPPHFLACSGARTVNIVSSNVVAGRANLGEPAGQATDPGLGDADLVTMSIGGNDMDFEKILRDCVSVQDCKSADERLLNTDLAALPGKLADAYKLVRANSKRGARIVIVDYPQIFSRSGSCFQLTTMTNEEISWIRTSTSAVNAIIKAKAVDINADVLHVEDLFDGHQLCDSTPWVNYPSLVDQQYSFHPNLDGQKAIAERLSRCVGPNHDCVGPVKIA